MIVATKGSIGVAAGRDAVWAALHDIERLALCVPGCRAVTRDGDAAYRVIASVRFGPVHVAFDGVVEIGESETPTRLCLSGRGRGGLAGAATGTATIRVTERADGCRVSYELEARPDGPIARLGPMALTGLAAALSEMFARRFADLFAADATRGREPRLPLTGGTRP